MKSYLKKIFGKPDASPPGRVAAPPASAWPEIKTPSNPRNLVFAVGELGDEPEFVVRYIEAMSAREAKTLLNDNEVIISVGQMFYTFPASMTQEEVHNTMQAIVEVETFNPVLH